MNYLLLHEDGTIEQTLEFDEVVNLQGVADGYLDVIRVPKYSTTFERLNSDGSWVAV